MREWKGGAVVTHDGCTQHGRTDGGVALSYVVVGAWYSEGVGE